MMKIKLNNGTEYPCLFLGYSGLLGVLYIEIPNMRMVDAITVFEDETATKEITYFDSADRNSGNTEIYKGFVILLGVEKPEQSEDYIRITLQRKFAEE